MKDQYLSSMIFVGIVLAFESSTENNSDHLEYQCLLLSLKKSVIRLTSVVAGIKGVYCLACVAN